jgi:hypothetical protein
LLAPLSLSYAHRYSLILPDGQISNSQDGLSPCETHRMCDCLDGFRFRLRRVELRRTRSLNPSQEFKRKRRGWPGRSPAMTEKRLPANGETRTASPRAQAKSSDPGRDKTTRRANHQNLSSPAAKNIPLNPSGKSVI